MSVIVTIMLVKKLPKQTWTHKQFAKLTKKHRCLSIKPMKLVPLWRQFILCHQPHLQKYRSTKCVDTAADINVYGRKDSDDRGGSLCRLSKLIVLLSIGSRGHFSGQLNTVPNSFTLKIYLVSVPVIFLRITTLMNTAIFGRSIPKSLDASFVFFLL